MLAENMRPLSQLWTGSAISSPSLLQLLGWFIPKVKTFNENKKLIQSYLNNCMQWFYIYYIRFRELSVSDYCSVSQSSSSRLHAVLLSVPHQAKVHKWSEQKRIVDKLLLSEKQPFFSCDLSSFCHLCETLKSWRWFPSNTHWSLFFFSVKLVFDILSGSWQMAATRSRSELSAADLFCFSLLPITQDISFAMLNIFPWTVW